MYLFCISCKQIVATIKVPTLVDEQNKLDEIVAFHCGVVQALALLDCYVAFNISYLPTLRNSLDCFTHDDVTDRMSRNVDK